MASIAFSVEVALYSIAGLALIFGSIFDLKTREVPDWLSYGLIFAGLGIRLIYSLAFFEWAFFFSGLLGFIVFVGFGYLMFYSGQWGGGDSKLLMGLGAIFGLPWVWPQVPLLAIFLAATLLGGAVYGLVWIVALAVGKSQAVGMAAHKLRAGTSKAETFTYVAAGVLLLALAFAWLQGFITVTGLLFATVPLAAYYSWLLVKSVEKVAFIRRVLPQHLTEGDWVVNDIIVDGQRICGPKDLGLEKEQIAQLMHLRDVGKIDKVLIKEGIPFVPSFLIAFVGVFLLKILGFL